MRLPIIGYSSVIICMIVVLAIQHGRISKQEAAAASQTQAVVDWSNRASIRNSLEQSEQETVKLEGTYVLARKVMKTLFLLLIVFPTAVWFPYQFSQEEVKPRQRPSKPKVLNIRDMTRDDVGRAIPRDAMQQEDDPQKSLVFSNSLAFLIPTVVLAFFVLSKPAAYGGPYAHGVMTLLLFAAGALISFAGMMLAFPLRRSNSAQQVLVYLSSMYVIAAGLAWFQL